MKYTESLKKNKDFRLVYNKGKSIANKYLVLYRLENHQGGNRLGISVSKKVGNSVVRSRVTRLIRESYRLQEENVAHPGWDFVVIARAGSKEATYHEIESALKHLLKKSNVYLYS
jgi:ribonuclease P protein component